MTVIVHSDEEHNKIYMTIASTVNCVLTSKKIPFIFLLLPSQK